MRETKANSGWNRVVDRSGPYNVDVSLNDEASGLSATGEQGSYGRVAVNEVESPISIAQAR